MEETDFKFKSFDKVLKLNKIYDPIKKEIIKEWEDWKNPDTSHKRDDDKINKLFNKLRKKCPYLYNAKRNEVYMILKSFIDRAGNHQIHYFYTKQEFDPEEFITCYDNENNPICGIRNEETSEEIVKNCVVTDKEYFDDCLQKTMNFFGFKDIL